MIDAIVKLEPFPHRHPAEEACRTCMDDDAIRPQVEREKPDLRTIAEAAGPSAPIVTNARGGKQSKTAGRFDMIPAKALFRMAEVFEDGAARYTRNNWRRIEYASHINHAIQHLAALLADDRSDDHVGHALVRLAMALEMEDPNYRFTAIEE